MASALFSPNTWVATPSEPKKLPAPPAIKIKDLASRGDIILLAGSPPSLKIKVSFDRLAECSPVFKRMLGGRFAEGQVKRSPEKPQTVTLPDNDAHAVSDMCHLLYHKVGKLAEASLGAERLYQLVVMTDKYGCVNVLRLQIRALIQKHLDGLDNKLHKLKWENSALRAGAAWLFGDLKLFEISTSHLISHFNEPLSALRKLPGGDLIPLNALLAMSEKRGKAQRRLCTGLSTVTIGGCDCGCCYDESDYSQELTEALDLMCWPPSFESGGETIAGMLERLESIKYSIGGGRDYDCSSDRQDRGQVWEVAVEVEKICKSLCLSCVREDCVEPLQQECGHTKKDK